MSDGNNYLYYMDAFQLWKEVKLIQIISECAFSANPPYPSVTRRLAKRPLPWKEKEFNNVAKMKIWDLFGVIGQTIIYIVGVKK